MTTFRTQYIVSCHNKLLMKFFLAWAVCQIMRRLIKPFSACPTERAVNFE